MEDITLSPTQIGRLYQKGSVLYEGVELTFVSDKAGKLQRSGDTTYNSAYERESQLIIKDGIDQYYEGTIFEGGSEKDDMQITSYCYFSPVEAPKPKRKKK